ncbi:MAG: D-alanyl-D-alanine carboxypeptidase [Oscillospiraceae bacterium]|nr:D-alanyl-D-alanine carboxypeptidase [Oscillospiraceae bacterium]
MKYGFVFLFLVIAVIGITSFDVNAVSIGGISAESYILIEAQTGKIIASHNEYEMRPMASTTKIMTTLLLLESGNLEEEFKVDNEAIKVEGSSMGLCEDDIVTKMSLCYGMMLPSGNDAANQTAVLLAGDTENFAVMMNERASKIGLKNTNFVTPSGLHNDKHYSTAYDMALLAREALKNETFKEICGTQRVKTQFGNPPYERWLVNTNKLLYMYEYCVGVKTGFTDEAGRCLVSAAEKDGVSLICVTLKAPDDWNDHIKLYDYGFSVTKTESIDYDYSKLSVSVAGGNQSQVAVVPVDTPVYTKINGEKTDISSEVILDKFIYAPVKAGQIVGKINFYADNKLIFSTELISRENCEAVICKYKPSLFEEIIEFIKGLT